MDKSNIDAPETHKYMTVTIHFSDVGQVLQ